MAATLGISGSSLLADLPNAFAELPQKAALDDYVALAIVAFFSTVWLLRGSVWDKPDPHLYKMFERPQEQMSGAKGAQETRNIAEKLDQVGSDVVIFWGSQSGTAERLANRLAKELRQRFGKRALAADVSDYDAASVANVPETKTALFIVSTFGEGDPSDNLHELWSWLETAKGKPLRNLRYMALGLGNSNYKHYNAVVDVVVNRLASLGALNMLPTGRADDAQGETEEHYLSWKDDVFSVLKSNLGYEEHDPVYEPSIAINEASPGSAELHHGSPTAQNLSRLASRTMSAPHALPVKSSRELFDATEGRNCIHMELDLSQYPGLKYKTGDHLGVWPSNPEIEVKRLLRSLDLTHKSRQQMTVTSLEKESKTKVPAQTTFDALLGHYLEICAPVSRETIASLVQFAPSQAAKTKLSALSSDSKAYAQFQAGSYVNLGRLLEYAAPEEGAWSALPTSFVVEVLPAMQPRYYSISSSSVVQPRQAAITAVVSDKTFASSNDRIPGLATNYLLAMKESLQGVPKPHPHGLTYPLQGPAGSLEGGKLHVQIRKSTFKLPTLASQPIIMVGAGTGIAPFRGFLQERARLLRMGREVGRTILFFGCRNESQDFIYRDELAELQAQLGDRLSIITAFSRPSDGKKVYVQDRVKESADEVCDLVQNQNAYVYICGSAAMAREVSNVVGAEVSARQGWNEAQLKEFADRQKKQRRWQQDVWG